MLKISYNTLSTILSFTRDTLFLVMNYIRSGQPEFQSLEQWGAPGPDDPGQVVHGRSYSSAAAINVLNLINIQVTFRYIDNIQSYV